MAKIVREVPENQPINMDYTKRLVEEFRKYKEAIEGMQKRLDGFKAEINEIIVKHGQPDEKGNIWVELGDMEIKRERRVSRSFNSSAAEAWAKQNGYWDVVKEVVEILSEDKLLGLAWNDPSIQETIKSFYVEKEVWALKA